MVWEESDRILLWTMSAFEWRHWEHPRNGSQSPNLVLDPGPREQDEIPKRSCASLKIDKAALELHVKDLLKLLIRTKIKISSQNSVRTTRYQL